MTTPTFSDTPPAMEPNEYYKIKGYISLLQQSTPNGRHVHSVLNKVQALAWYLKIDTPLNPNFEEDIKQLLHQLYSS